MTAPSAVQILLFVVALAGVYRLAYWRDDHPRKAARVRPPTLEAKRAEGPDPAERIDRSTSTTQLG